MNILMVCLGNICRSPIAEGVMQHKYAVHQLKGRIDSAGMIGYHSGDAPDKRAIAISLKHHIDISNQRARQFSAADFAKYDLILAMDQSVYQEILNKAKSETEESKVHLFMDLSNISKGKDVPDPYYGGPEGFENVFKMIDSCCDEIAEKISKSEL